MSRRARSAIASGAVTNSTIAIGAVVSGSIASGAVTNSTIAIGAVDSGSIASGAVGTPEIASSAVTSAQIASGAVTGADIDYARAQNSTESNGDDFKSVIVECPGEKVVSGGGFQINGLSTDRPKITILASQPFAPPGSAATKWAVDAEEIPGQEATDWGAEVGTSRDDARLGLRRPGQKRGDTSRSAGLARPARTFLYVTTGAAVAAALFAAARAHGHE